MPNWLGSAVKVYFAVCLAGIAYILWTAEPGPPDEF